MPFSLKVNPLVCGRWRPVLGMDGWSEGGREGWREEQGVDMDLKEKLLFSAIIFIYWETL